MHQAQTTEITYRKQPMSWRDSDLFPLSAESEQGLLGCLLIAPEKFWDVQGIVTAEDFEYPGHADIWREIEKRSEAGEPVGVVAMSPILSANNALPDPGYLADLAASLPFVGNCVDYAEAIADYAQRRRLIAAMEGAWHMLANPENEVDSVRSFLAGEMESKAESSFVKTKREVAEEVVKGLTLPPNCYPTSIDALDRAMAGGLYEGFTYALCGQEKRGKTTFAHTISQNLNDSGIDHAYVALEMGSAQIEARNMARGAGVNSLEFLKRDKDPELVKRLSNRAVTMRDHTLYLDMPGCSFSQIKAELIKLQSKGKIKGFIVDYWQLVGGCDPRGNKADFLYEVAQWFANWARRHKLFCIMLSQVNRQGEVYASAGLEKACDQMFFIEKSANPSQWNGADLWLKMTRSRYTPICDVGNENNPVFLIDQKAGPYVREA